MTSTSCLHFLNEGSDAVYLFCTINLYTTLRDTLDFVEAFVLKNNWLFCSFYRQFHILIKDIASVDVEFTVYRGLWKDWRDWRVTRLHR